MEERTMLKSITVQAVAIATCVLVASTLGSASSAEAGMRIHFGFPIGAFYAYGGHSARYHSYDAYRPREIRRAKAIEAELKREKAAAAAAKARKEQAPAEPAAKAGETTKKKAAAASLAPNQKALQPETATISESPKSVEPGDDVAVIPPLPEKSETLRTGANAAIMTNSEAEVAQEDSQPLMCKRYFANVGMTISVPCSK